MATIDYKEKYEQAMGRARQFIEKPYLEDSAGIVRHIFPELAKSDDEKMRAMAIKAVYAPEAQSCIKSWGINPDDVIAWLEKQSKDSPVLSNSSNTGKSSWSEEDRKLIDETCDLINTLASGYGEKVTEPISFSGAQQISNIKTRLRSLVEPIPQDRWKPSDEQMDALNDVISSRDIKYDILSELWKDLKKLMEE